MVSVKTQLKRHITKLAKSIKADCVIQHDSFSTGVIYFKCSDFMNYNDIKVYYMFENSTSNYDLYRLHITCDWDNIFDSINKTIIEIKE